MIQMRHKSELMNYFHQISFAVLSKSEHSKTKTETENGDKVIKNIPTNDSSHFKQEYTEQ